MRKTTKLDETPTPGTYVVFKDNIKFDHIGHYMEGITIKDAGDTTNIAEMCGGLPPLEAIANATLLATAANAVREMNPDNPLCAARAIKHIVQVVREIIEEGHETDGDDRRVSQGTLERLDHALRTAGVEVELPVRA